MTPLQKTIAASLQQVPDCRYLVVCPTRPRRTTAGLRTNDSIELYMEQPRRDDDIPTRVVWHARWENATRFTLEQAVRYVLLLHAANDDARVHIEEVIRREDGVALGTRKVDG